MTENLFTLTLPSPLKGEGNGKLLAMRKEYLQDIIF